MKKSSIALIITASIVVILLIASVAASLVKLETYSVSLDIEGVNSYPPRLTQLVDRGSSKETGLTYILPSISFGKLYSGSAQTEMSGVITLICGAGYEEIQEWSVDSNTYGVELLSKHTFEGVPADTTCIAEAVTSECRTDIQNGKCETFRRTITLKIPGDNN